MLKFLFILSFLSFKSFAEDPHPHAPHGWIEMNSIEPVILTWVKLEPEKELKDATTFTIQHFDKNEKFIKFINQHKADVSGCFDVEDKDWKQTWCTGKSKFFAILTRGTDKESPKIKSQLKAWVLTHD